MLRHCRLLMPLDCRHAIRISHVIAAAVTLRGGRRYSQYAAVTLRLRHIESDTASIREMSRVIYH